MTDIHSVSSVDGRLVVEFHWRDDRFVQHIHFDRKLVGNSVEGDSESTWPPSAPIQQLSAETIDGQPMMLGVGGAGRSHWSISARPCSDNESAIQFDLACRVKESPEFLGSTYRLDPLINVELINVEPINVASIAVKQGSQADSVVIASTDTDKSTRQWSFRMSTLPQSS